VLVNEKLEAEIKQITATKRTSWITPTALALLLPIVGTSFLFIYKEVAKYSNAYQTLAENEDLKVEKAALLSEKMALLNEKTAINSDVDRLEAVKRQAVDDAKKAEPGRSTDAKQRNNVVLPAPLAPVRATLSPSATSRSTPRSTIRPPRTLDNPRARIAILVSCIRLVSHRIMRRGVLGAGAASARPNWSLRQRAGSPSAGCEVAGPARARPVSCRWSFAQRPHTPWLADGTREPPIERDSDARFNSI
jgi:hypothetical protein